MKYFVLSNLSHNNRQYSRGATLDLSDEAAQPLLVAGVIQSEPIEDAPTPEVQTPVEVPQPVVGGEKIQTGEPSIDGPSGAPRAEVEDITPIVDEPSAPTPEVQTPEEPKRGQSGRRKPVSQPEAPQEPADPSANL